ncbi:hypothetical protein ACJJTC_002515 [Scirpophaga incertulas]
MNIENLDKALHDLGMLSAITDARRDFLRESKSSCSMVRLNSRYVSRHCMKRMVNKNRLCPYVLPARHRTKSENSETMTSDVLDSGCEYKGMEPSTSGYNAHECVESPAKRCQSLENLNLLVESQPATEISPDMDCVSTRIQKLHVDE